MDMGYSDEYRTVKAGTRDVSDDRCALRDEGVKQDRQPSPVERLLIDMEKAIAVNTEMIGKAESIFAVALSPAQESKVGTDKETAKQLNFPLGERLDFLVRAITTNNRLIAELCSRSRL